MKKEFYDKAEIEIVSLTMTDVLKNSPDPETDDEDELPFVPANPKP